MIFSIRSTISTAAIILASSVVFPNLARAQYKNMEFGLDAGYWVSTKPSILNAQGFPKQGSNRPLRMPPAFRLGGETSFKMHDDHWWFLGRMNLALFINTGGASCALSDPGCFNKRFDSLADTGIGDLLGLQLQIATRYLILTDRLRPYVQVGLSYMRVFSFSSQANDLCENTFIGQDQGACLAGRSNYDTFLPHPNVWAFHIQPGFEIVYSRDKAVNLFLDMQRWLIINAKGNWGFVFGVGFNFFT